MKVFSVHEPAEAASDRIDRAEAFVFVKDGFSWSAALLGPIWLASERNWRGLAVYVAAIAAILAALYAVGASPTAMIIAVLAVNVFLGFESSEIERQHLETAGWAMLGTVSGTSLAECERRFFESWLPSQPVIAYPAAEPDRAAAFANPARPAPVAAPISGGLLDRLGFPSRKR